MSSKKMDRLIVLLEELSPDGKVKAIGLIAAMLGLPECLQQNMMAMASDYEPDTLGRTEEEA